MTRKEKITKILDKYWIRRGWIESDESMVEAIPLTAKEELADAIMAIPLEMPSEEEIKIQAFNDIPIFILEDHPKAGDVNEGCRDSAIEFAKWMRNEILKRNKTD